MGFDHPVFNRSGLIISGAIFLGRTARRCGAFSPPARTGTRIAFRRATTVLDLLKTGDNPGRDGIFAAVRSLLSSARSPGPD